MTNGVTFSAPNFATSFAPTSFLMALQAPSRLSLPGVSSAGTKRSPASAFASARISSGTIFSVISRFVLADFRGEFLLRGDQRLDDFLRVFQRGVEVGLGNFLGRAFIHDDVFFVADIDEIEIALGLFGVRRDWRRTCRRCGQRAPRRAARPTECR